MTAEAEGLRNSLEAQQLELLTFTAEGLGSIPGQGTKIPQATWFGKKKKKKKKKERKLMVLFERQIIDNIVCFLL